MPAGRLVIVPVPDPVALTVIIAIGTPTPLRLSICGLVLAASLIETAPSIVPVLVGVKVTETVQLLPACNCAGQSFVCEKSPLAAILLIESEVERLFVILAVLTVEVVLTPWFPKFRLTTMPRCAATVPPNASALT